VRPSNVMDMAEKPADPARQLEQDIRDHEARLEKLRNDYMKLTGHMPVKLNDFEWKWSVFMGIGFAYISMIVYLLGIAHAGEGSEYGIPSFFFGTDIAYFPILTMYALLMLMMAQARKLSGLQSMSFILGFWCTHWLFYDWGWYAYLIGIHDVIPDAAFWASAFGRNFLVVDPPMWLFLAEAITGVCIGLYSFTMPRRRRHLIPPILWLYGTYFNATILELTGVSAESISIVAICFLVAVFGTIALFLGERIIERLPEWRSKRETRLKLKLKLDPLGFPLGIVMVGLAAMTNIFLVLEPAVGLFFGLVPWYIVPIYYILIRSTGIAKASRVAKIVVVTILSTIFIIFLVLVSVLPIADMIG
jgi:hypothetical protein